jgi:hypothetical protein
MVQQTIIGDNTGKQVALESDGSLPITVKGGTVVVDESTLATSAKQDAANVLLGQLAASTDTPYVGVEDATSRGLISLLKGIKNHIYALAGCIIASVSLTCGYNQIVQTTTIACPATASGAYIAGDRVGPATGLALSELTGMALASGRGGTITQVQVVVNKKAITPRIRVHFYSHYSATGPIPSALVADNAPRKELYADVSYLVGYVDLVAMSSASDAASDVSRSQEVYAGQFPLPYACQATSLWVSTETLDGIAGLDNNTNITIKVKSMLN